jgi:hypothetical protein
LNGQISRGEGGACGAAGSSAALALGMGSLSAARNRCRPSSGSLITDAGAAAGDDNERPAGDPETRGAVG